MYEYLLSRYWNWIDRFGVSVKSGDPGMFHVDWTCLIVHTSTGALLTTGYMCAPNVAGVNMYGISTGQHSGPTAFSFVAPQVECVRCLAIYCFFAEQLLPVAAEVDRR